MATHFVPRPLTKNPYAMGISNEVVAYEKDVLKALYQDIDFSPSRWKRFLTDNVKEPVDYRELKQAPLNHIVMIRFCGLWGYQNDPLLKTLSAAGMMTKSGLIYLRKYHRKQVAPKLTLVYEPGVTTEDRQLFTTELYKRMGDTSGNRFHRRYPPSQMFQLIVKGVT